MKTFKQIRSTIGESQKQEVLKLVEHYGNDGFGRGGYQDPHHLSGRGQLLDVLIRKISQMGYADDKLAQEVAEKMGVKLGPDGGVQSLLKALKTQALGFFPGDKPSERDKRESLAVASQIYAQCLSQSKTNPVGPEAWSTTHGPDYGRTPPNQGTGRAGDPVGYANQGNLDFSEQARQRARLTEAKLLKEVRFSGAPGRNFKVSKDHVKLFSGKVTAFTRRDGYWTDYDAVKMPTTYKVDVWWRADSYSISDAEWFELPYIDVFVYDYNANRRLDLEATSGLIYTDGSFLRSINELARSKGFPGTLDYTEQGMQGTDWVSMEANRSFGRELAKRFPAVVKKALKEEVPQRNKLTQALADGLRVMINDVRAAREQGDFAQATFLRRMVMQIVHLQGLDVQKVLDLLDEQTSKQAKPLKEAKLSLGEDITPILKQIVDQRSAKSVKFDNGVKRTIDLFSASALIRVHDALSPENQEKMRRMMSKNEREFDRIMAFAFDRVK